MIPAELKALADLDLHVHFQGWVGPPGANDVKVRFRAGLLTNFVQFHVQNTSTGGLTYNPSTYVSSTLIDCRADRSKVQTVTRNGTDNYAVWMIPVFVDQAGNSALMDGQSGRPDRMAAAYLGG